MARGLKQGIIFMFMCSVSFPGGTIAQTGLHKNSGEEKEQLKFVLILSRHGVRAPLDQPSEYSSQPWPTWEVPLGNLTPHGGEALRQMGEYMRLKYAEEGLVATDACFGPSEIYLYSDTDQRNVSSARETFSGFAPGCPSIPIHTVSPSVPDPLFKGVSVKLPSVVDAIAARRDALMAESPNVFAPESIAQLTLLDHILSPGPAKPGKKSILSPIRQHAAEAPDIVEASKPRAIASEIVEDVLLEYVDGKPLSEVGWGRVDEATLLKLMPIRIAAFDLEKRTLLFARIARSNLLAHILDTIDQAATNAPMRGALGQANTRLVYIGGHDSDLVGVGGLLGLHWTADGRSDDAPPDSQIVFELWRNTSTKQDTIRIRYRAQTLAQLRAASHLTDANPPDEVLLIPTGCAATVGCPWSLFLKNAKGRLSTDHVNPDLTPSQIVQ